MEALILCAGKSKRARNKKQILSKLLFYYKSQTLLQFHIKKAIKFNLIKFYFNVFFKKKKIIDNIKKNINGMNYKIIKEKKLMGTCGALQALKKKIKKPFFVIYPDNISDCNYDKMVAFHNKNKSDLTIATYLENNTKNSGLINFNKNNLVSSFEEKKNKKFKKPKWCNAGIYILSSKIINILDKKDKDFAKDLFPRIIKLGFKLYVFKINKLLTFDTLKLYNKNKLKII